MHKLAHDARGLDRARFGVDDLDLEMGVHQAHGADALVERRVDPGLETDRAGFSHAVGDFDLGHVHQFIDLLHGLDRTGRAGHDSSAQAAQVVIGELRQGQLGDEHGGHAVERGRPLRLHCLQHRRGIETLAGIDGAGGVGEAAEIAHDHAETMVQGHGNHQPVAFAEVHDGGDEAGIVENIVMGQGGALGEARGAAGVLDVDRIVYVLVRLPRIQILLVAGIREGKEIRPAVYAACFGFGR